MNGLRYDIFCRVVDNYGDAGVCWRLARQLASEHGLDVTLRIDRLATLARLEPAIEPDRRFQRQANVDVRVLDDEDDGARSLPDVVIEGFGCGLPDRYLDAMEAQTPAPLWLNLEYLSAEPWVETVHGLASPQPKRALTRHFWFPGFTPHTGGLIREAGLFAARDAALARPASRGADNAFRITLFCYPNRALPALFDAWSEGDEPIACAIPEGVATAALDVWLHGDVPHAGQSVTHGRLHLDVMPFATQDAFDRLLWRSNLNVVRGEDSFVRAQWAARAFVWQPYPQEGEAHRLKLDAFLVRYAAGLPDEASAPLVAFWRAFNDGDGIGAATAWPAFREANRAVEAYGRRWADELAAIPELTAGLVEFARGRL